MSPPGDHTLRLVCGDGALTNGAARQGQLDGFHKCSSSGWGCFQLLIVCWEFVQRQMLILSFFNASIEIIIWFCFFFSLLLWWTRWISFEYWTNLAFLRMNSFGSDALSFLYAVGFNSIRFINNIRIYVYEGRWAIMFFSSSSGFAAFTEWVWKYSLWKSLCRIYIISFLKVW